MKRLKYQIGYTFNSDGILLQISYAIEDGEIPREVMVQMGEGPPATEANFEPARMLDFQMGRSKYELIDGELKWVGWDMEPPGWFRRKCEEANCSWFYPMVERMARGEDVPLKEIQAAYRENNDGREMPEGKWGSSFTV